ncbi:hypothetical protein B0A52_04756 [Exophiala mesophila]|uniref:F-box domain-containing protein n=1 Tax=Exophiala mesophila TaxID=212818 RepID=A0A438N999_EXOME|nr:hypothetical protein B0A52_04756 [Exophiala mesophila]
MMELLDLPNEILAKIISFLDQPSPFDQSIREKPFLQNDDISPTTKLPRTVPADASLKNVSTTCSLLRSTALPDLFKHVKVNPLRLSDFIAFLNQNHLNQRVVSVVAIVLGHYNHIHPAWWARLLNEVTATRFSIIAAPSIFAELAGNPTWSNDAWAFNMPFQILSLDQSAEASRCKIDYDNLPSLLTARPWTRALVNEGSSVLAYTTYEYFFRHTPSMLSALHYDRSIAGDQMFANLEEFKFVAIFPFYNHVEEVLKCIRKMTNLRRLFIKICPSPESTVLHDEIEAAGGHFDINDPWNECDTSWRLIAHNVAALAGMGNLREFHMDDVHVEGVRQALEDSINRVLQEPWTYQGKGSGEWRVNAASNAGRGAVAGL